MMPAAMRLVLIQSVKSLAFQLRLATFVTDERHAFLWENDQMIDLNIFLPPNSDLQQLTDAYNINDRGEIVGLGVPPGCGDEFSSCGHAFVLIPCDEKSSRRRGLRL